MADYIRNIHFPVEVYIDAQDIDLDSPLIFGQGSTDYWQQLLGPLNTEANVTLSHSLVL